MFEKIASNIDLTEIDLPRYGINEGSGTEFSITLRNPAEPDRVHVVFARDRKPGPEWVPFAFKFTHGNIRSKTLFVHKDEIPFCEAYKNAGNKPAPSKGASPTPPSYFEKRAFIMEKESLIFSREEMLMERSFRIWNHQPSLDRLLQGVEDEVEKTIETLPLLRK